MPNQDANPQQVVAPEVNQAVVTTQQNIIPATNEIANNSHNSEIICKINIPKVKYLFFWSKQAIHVHKGKEDEADLALRNSLNDLESRIVNSKFIADSTYQIALGLQSLATMLEAAVSKFKNIKINSGLYGFLITLCLQGVTMLLAAGTKKLADNIKANAECYQKEAKQSLDELCAAQNKLKAP